MRPKTEKTASDAQQETEVITPESRDASNLDDEQTDKLVVDQSDQKVITSAAKTRQPKCTKCRNHDLIVAKKNHKGICPFESCTCPKCRNIDERRHVLKNQVRIRRHLDQKEREMKDQEHDVCQVDSHTLSQQQTSTQIPKSSVSLVSTHSSLPSFNSHAYRYSQLTYLTDSSNEESLSISSISEPEHKENPIDIPYELQENNLNMSQVVQESNVYYHNYQYQTYQY